MERQGRGSVGGGGSEAGVQSSLPLGAPTICGAHPFSVLQPHFHQGQGLGEGGSVSCRERSGRACSFAFSRLLQPGICGYESLGIVETSDRFVNPQSGVCKTPFKMETLHSVLLSVRSGDWMVSIDLKDAYLQVPVHPDSRKYRRFVGLNQVFQFKALCFGRSTAPQVFTQVMALAPAILHHLGICMCRYLDDWLIQAPSRSLFSRLWRRSSICVRISVLSSTGRSPISFHRSEWFILELSWIPLFSGLLPPSRESRSYA